MTTDPAAAQAFYTKAIGWGVSQLEGLEMPYAMWMRGEMPVGGCMGLPEDAKAGGAPPNWMMYVGADDVDASFARAIELGATPCVPPPQDIPTVGRFAVIFDPQGAALALYKPLQELDVPEAPPQVGEFSWHELLTTDHTAAAAFYQALFGWEEKAANDMGPTGLYRVFGRGPLEWGGMFNRPPQMADVPVHWLLYIKVADIHAAAAAVTANGGQVLFGPMEVPGGHWTAKCLDPQGAVFALHQDKP